MIELPADIKNVNSLSDWVELCALEQDDNIFSFNDVTNALQIGLGSAEAKELSYEAFIELEKRKLYSGEAYPFNLKSAHLLSVNRTKEAHLPYLFCLFISYYGGNNKLNNVDPRLLFEELSGIAAKNYFDGQVYIFGTSRKNKGQKIFAEAVNELASKIGEGVGIRNIRTLSKKDDHVDLVAWKDFIDKRESKLVVFGQCATGKNWKDKLSELDAPAFWSQWLKESNVSPLFRSFFIPFCLTDDENGEEWKYCGRYGGIFFDRCRVSYWASRSPHSFGNNSAFRKWSNQFFNF